MRIPRYFAAAIVFAAWLMFIVSFFLPATNVMETAGTPPGTPLTGWQAFTSIHAAGHPLVIIAFPRTLLLFLFPIINLAMVLAPMIVLSWSVESRPLSAVFLIFGIVPWLVPREFTGDLFIGFYLWDASFFAMAIGCVLVSIRRRQWLDPMP